MKIQIAENIRKYRKERGLTQEQLAEALGVTVGAVSKWELGASVPDISLIMELADFFEISIDVLLGYEWRSSNMHKALERIKSTLQTKEYWEGIKEAEKALIKYPNNFDITYYSAVVYEIAGIEGKNPKQLQRALELLQRAGDLIGQNTDIEISESTIKMNMVEIYLGLGETENAISLLKQYNYGGANNAMLGYVLSVFCDETDQALPYLSKALLTNMTELFRINLGFLMTFWDKDDIEKAWDILQWTLGILRGLKTGTAVSYLDKMEVFLLPVGAAILTGKADEKGAEEYMRLAYEVAIRFDEAPCYNVTGIKYYCGDLEISAADDMGSTAMESVENIIYQIRSKDEKISELLCTIWEEIRNEKAND